jgi:hypothetical protein
MSESKFYDKDFWFNKTHLHGDVNGYTSEYYVCKIYEDVIFKLSDIPDNGYIVMLGTNNCVAFDMLCDKFGSDRCLGYDIANPKNNSRVITKNALDLSLSDNIDIAFVHNDIGSFPTTPIAKWAAQCWAAPNVVSGGYFLGRNNFNSAKYPLEQHLTRHGFINTHFLGIKGLMDLTRLDEECVEGHMISKRSLPELR